jgi:hypothetical protein
LCAIIIPPVCDIKFNYVHITILIKLYHNNSDNHPFSLLAYLTRKNLNCAIIII